MQLSVNGISSDEFSKFQLGGLDANGQPAITKVATGGTNPCRHCLELISEGDEMLILSYRPFDALQPYAEVGPIFLHKESCQHYSNKELPAYFDYLEPAIIRGYDENDWIRYETGNVVSGSDLTKNCFSILSESNIAYVHIRSKFNCFQCRVDRA